MSLIVACLLVACGIPVVEAERTGAVITSGASDAGATSDAGALVDAGSLVDAGAMADAGVSADGGAPTYTRDAQPIFSRHCTRCHVAGNGGLTSFVDRYELLSTASTVCRGQTVATCIGWVLADQAMEGRTCRTYEVRSFHREGFLCVSAQDIATVQAWLAAGARE